MIKNKLIQVSVISYTINLISEGGSVNFWPMPEAMPKVYELSKYTKNSILGYYQLGIYM